MHNPDGRAAEADLVARVGREEHLVAGLDAAALGADGGDDAGAAVRLQRGMMSPRFVSDSSSDVWMTT